MNSSGAEPPKSRSSLLRRTRLHAVEPHHPAITASWGSVTLAPPPEAVAELPLSFATRPCGTVAHPSEFEAIRSPAIDLERRLPILSTAVTPPAGVRSAQTHRRRRGPGLRALPLQTACRTRDHERWRSSTRSPTSPMTSATSPVSYTATFSTGRAIRCTACSSIRKT
jgi:hypothetical protein